MAAAPVTFVEARVVEAPGRELTRVRGVDLEPLEKGVRAALELAFAQVRIAWSLEWRG
jgi:hypothetical protein